MEQQRTHDDVGPLKMKAAHMYEVGKALVLEEVPLPAVGSMDVRVRVRSCGIVPNLANVLALFPTWFPDMPLPPLPAIFGLDPAGEIAAVGHQIFATSRSGIVSMSTPAVPADAVVIAGAETPFMSALRVSRTYENYKDGGMAEYVVAPASAIILISDRMTFDHAARLGYIGTGYSALKKANVGPGDAILVNGISGILGLSIAVFGPLFDVKKILGTGRDRRLLQEIEALVPGVIKTFSLEDGMPDEWARSKTLHNEGVDAFIDCSGPGTLAEPFLAGLAALRRGGVALNIRAANVVPIDVHAVLDRGQTIIGSAWFTTSEGQEIADFIGNGKISFDMLETQATPLEEVNQAISGMPKRHGGFSNFVIHP